MSPLPPYGLGTLQSLQIRRFWTCLVKEKYQVCPFMSDLFHLNLEVEMSGVSDARVDLQTGGTDLCIGGIRP